jgi:hypothetical protein
MPLAADGLVALQQEILKFSDPTHPEFVGFPQDAGETAERWSNALKVFIGSAVIPIWADPSAAFNAAASAMKATMLAPTYTTTQMQGEEEKIVFISTPPAAPLAIAAGMTTFMTTLVAPPFLAGALIGLIPVLAFIPPPLPFVTTPLPAVPTPPPASAAAAKLAGEILAWVVTAQATPSTPPGAPPVPWS